MAGTIAELGAAAERYVVAPEVLDAKDDDILRHWTDVIKNSVIKSNVTERSNNSGITFIYALVVPTIWMHSLLLGRRRRRVLSASTRFLRSARIPLEAAVASIVELLSLCVACTFGNSADAEGAIDSIYAHLNRVVLGNMASAMIPRACFFEKERVTRMPTHGPDATDTTIRLTVISGVTSPLALGALLCPLPSQLGGARDIMQITLIS